MGHRMMKQARTFPWLNARKRGLSWFFWLVVAGLGSLVFIFIRRLEDNFLMEDREGGEDEGYITLPESPTREAAAPNISETPRPPVAGLSEVPVASEDAKEIRGEESLLTVEEEAAEAGSALESRSGEIRTGSGNQEEEIITSGAEAVDDLKIVEGIGPKTEDLLHKAGITTYTQLAATPEERLEGILAEANLRMMNPGTWKEQASLAAAGDWGGLEKLKSQLKGGRRAS